MSKSDDLLLAAAQRLIAKGGPSPTFAEITSEAGFSPKSKGAVYRRLSRLRGSYVDWDDQVQRSFRVLGQHTTSTATVVASAGVSTPRSVLDTIRLLATGLWQLTNHEDASRELPPALRRGLSKLALAAIEAGKRGPANMAEAISLFRTPFSDWPIAHIPSELGPDAYLLEGTDPTSLCTELVISGSSDSEAELMEQPMVNVLNQCRLYERPEDYVKLRRFVIERPVVELREIVSRRLNLPPEVASVLDEIYEPIPPELISEGSLFLCGYCGWTVQRNSRGIARCIGSVCRVRGGEGASVAVAPSQLTQWRRVNRGIRRFVVEPGRAELDLAEKMKRIGTKVDLWPAFDTYDLRVEFPTARIIWAIDVKDWENPYLLARFIDAKGAFPEVPSWDSAFYVFPEHRSRMRPRYAAAFAGAWHGRRERVSYAMERVILQMAKKELSGSEN